MGRSLTLLNIVMSELVSVSDLRGHFSLKTEKETQRNCPPKGGTHGSSGTALSPRGPYPAVPGPGLRSTFGDGG